MRHDLIDPGAGGERPARPAVGPSVADRMTAPVTIGRDEPLAHASELMARWHIRHLPVVDADGKLIGNVTDGDVRDVLQRAGVPDAESAPATLAVRNVMRRDVVSIAPSARLADAAALMRHRKLSAVPVVADGKVVGILRA